MLHRPPLADCSGHKQKAPALGSQGQVTQGGNVLHPHQKGASTTEIIQFFAVYLREYRAEILESAAWLQCPDDTATGIPMRLAGSA